MKDRRLYCYQFEKDNEVYRLHDVGFSDNDVKALESIHGKLKDKWVEKLNVELFIRRDERECVLE